MPAILVLTTGCSTSGPFGKRASRDHSPVAEAFPSHIDSVADSNRTSAPPSERRDAPPPPSRIQLASGESRRGPAEYLAAAARHEKAGDMQAARADYERVVRLDPAHLLANYQLAVIADNERRFSDSERHYRVLLAQTPRNPDLLASVGWSYLLQERYEESEQALRQALTIDPSHQTALYNLGWLYGNLGDYEQALAVFRKAGSEEDAQRAIAELFPRGRPAVASQAPAGAPRNPFQPPGDGAAAEGLRGITNPHDQLPRDKVSAPAPWNKSPASTNPVSKSERPPADPATEPPRVASAPTAQPASPQNEIHDAGRFDEVFAELDASKHSSPVISSAPQGPSERPLPPQESHAGPHDPLNIVTTADYDRVAETNGENPGPRIRPKSTRRSKAVDPKASATARQESPAPSAPRPGPDRTPKNESELSEVSPPARKPAAPPRARVAATARALPDWPYHAESARSTAPETAGTAPPPTPAVRAAAAQLGLSAGPGGLLFPATVPAAATRDAE